MRPLVRQCRDSSHPARYARLTVRGLLQVQFGYPASERLRASPTGPPLHLVRTGPESRGHVHVADFLPLPPLRVGGCTSGRIQSSTQGRSDSASRPGGSRTGMRTWLSGRASPCQGEGRGFESRRPLGSGYAAGSAAVARSMAEWPSGLGKGLQSPVHGFDSRLRLTSSSD
jgi:hypothetical protein